MATLDNSMNSVYMQQGAQSGPWWGAGDATAYGTPVDGSFLNTSNRGGQDPDLTAAMQYLRGVMQGDNVPFTDAVKAQMLGQQSSMNAAAEAGQNQALRTGAAVGGASGNDPSLRGALRQSMAARQGANTTAAGQINTQATLANQQAQSQAGQQLAGWGNQREARNKAQNASQYSAAQLFGGDYTAPRNTNPQSFLYQS